MRAYTLAADHIHRLALDCASLPFSCVIEGRGATLERDFKLAKVRGKFFRKRDLTKVLRRDTLYLYLGKTKLLLAREYHV